MQQQANPQQAAVGSRSRAGKSLTPHLWQDPASQTPIESHLALQPKGNVNSLIIRLPVQIPPGHSAYVAPIPNNLKAAILEKHQQWLQTNAPGKAELADPIEDELDELENQAKMISLEGLKAWKCGEGGGGGGGGG